MYCSPKNNPPRVLSSAKALFLGLFFMLEGLLTPFVYSAPLEAATYRAAPNPQEISARLRLQDAGAKDSLYFASALGIFSPDAGGYLRPQRNLTEIEALAAILNASGTAVKVQGDWKKAYLNVAKSSGLLSKAEQARLTSSQGAGIARAQDLYRWLSAALSSASPIPYGYQPASPINRSILADSLYAQRAQIAQRRGYQHLAGVVEQVSAVLEDGQPKQQALLSLSAGGQARLLYQNDLPWVRQGRLSWQNSALRAGDKADLFLKDGQVALGFLSAPVSVSVKGSLSSVDAATLELKNFQSEKIERWPVHQDARFFMVTGELGERQGARPARPEELLAHQDVEALVLDGKVSALYAYLEPQPERDGYLPKEGERVYGSVVSIEPDALTLLGGARYGLAEDALFMQQGEAIDADALKEGDRVTLYFDAPGKQQVSRVDIEGAARRVDTVVRATLVDYAPGKRELILKEVRVLGADRWEAAPSSYQKIRLQGEVFVGSQKIPQAQISRYKNQQIYGAISANHGRPALEKTHIRSGSALAYADQILEVNHENAYLNLGSQILRYTDSTLIVKDGRLVSPAALQKGLVAFAEASAAKDLSLLVMKDTGLLNGNEQRYPYKVYRGSLQDIFEHKLVLGEDRPRSGIFYLLQGGLWSEQSANAQIPFTDSTLVADYKTGKIQTIEDFKALRQEAFERPASPSDESDYRNWKAYVVTYKDSAIAINLVDVEGYQQVNSQIVLTGKTKSVDDQKKSLTLTGLSRYNALTGAFMPADGEQVLDISKAVIVENGRPVPLSKAGQLAGKRLQVIYRQNTTAPGQAAVILVQ